MSQVGASTEDIAEIVERAHDDLMNLTDKRILITGGTGFLGKWMLQSLIASNKQLNLNLEIAVASRNPTEFTARFPWSRARGVTFHEVDISMTDNKGRLNLPSADVLVHAAANAASNPVNASVEEVIQTTIVGTLNVFRTAAIVGCERAINISSGAIYGHQPEDVLKLHESHFFGPNPLDIRAGYHHSKRMGEYIAQSISHDSGIEVVTARLFSFLGPHLPTDSYFAAGNFIGDAVAGRTINITGDGSPVRSYQYPTDLIVALLALLVRGRNGLAYNVGSEESVSLLALAGLISALSHARPSIKVSGRGGTNLAGQRYVPDLQRLKHELHFTNAVDLQEAVRRTLKWYGSPTR